MNRNVATLLLGLTCWVQVATTISLRAAAANETNGASGFRVAFSRSMFADINVNDARTSVRAWAQTVAQQSGIPTLFCLRADYAPPFREPLIHTLSQLQDTPSGRQVPTVFQGSRMVREPLASLASAYELLRRYDPLNAGAAPTPVAPR